jgi:hypothetical protein
MKIIPTLFAGFLVLGGVGRSATAMEGTAATNANGILLKEEAWPGSNYCHMQFRAIRDETLSSDERIPKNDSDIIDYYGPCDHDPMGEDAAADQRRQRLSRPGARP